MLLSQKNIVRIHRKQQRDLRCSEDTLRAEDTWSEVWQKACSEADAGSWSIRVRWPQKESPYHPPLTNRAYPTCS
jgi:hypothetical protein